MSDKTDFKIVDENVVTLETEFCADSVEWCPFHPYHNILAGGSYQLEEANGDESAKRIGQIQLYLFDSSEAKLSKKSCLDVDGVLDMKWCPWLIEEKVVCGKSETKIDQSIWV